MAIEIAAQPQTKIRERGFDLVFIIFIYVVLSLIDLPHLHHIFPAHAGGMPKLAKVVAILVRSLNIHIARIPVTKHWKRLRPPVRPDPEFGVLKPLRAFKLSQGFPGWFKRSFFDPEFC